MKDKQETLTLQNQLMNKNILTNYTFTDTSQLDIFAGIDGKKTIIMDNEVPLKYSVLARDATIDIDVNTARDGSELKIFILTPVVEKLSSKININLNLRHNRCKIDLHMVSLVFSDAENQASATIYMQPGIQESSSELLEETVVLGNRLNVRNLPILDIQANNIAAAHGAKIYRLDEQKLFYLQSKWLSAQQARALLISSYPNMLFEDTMEKEEEKEQIIAEFLDFDAHYHA